jgi:hypothetical protein
MSNALRGGSDNSGWILSMISFLPETIHPPTGLRQAFIIDAMGPRSPDRACV